MPTSDDALRLRVMEAKTARGRRILKARMGQLVEGPKRTLFLHGPKTSQVGKDTLVGLRLLRKPWEKALTRKNDIRPFEDESRLQFLCEKNDSSLFAYTSHSKKRPHNLILGRMFDFQLLDMVELGIDRYRPQASDGAATKKLGSPPCMVFLGDKWEVDATYVALKSLFVDHFRGRVVEQLNLKALDHVMSFVVVDERIYIRNYYLLLKRSGTRVPRVELARMGPSLDLSVRRSRLAPSDLAKAARRQPAELRKKRQKNTKFDSVLGKTGRVYLAKQDLSELTLHHSKALRKRRRLLGEEEEEEGEEGEESKEIDDDDDDDDVDDDAADDDAAAAAAATAAADDDDGGRRRGGAPRRKKRRRR